MSSLSSLEKVSLSYDHGSLRKWRIKIENLWVFLRVFFAKKVYFDVLHAIGGACAHFRRTHYSWALSKRSSARSHRAMAVAPMFFFSFLSDIIDFRHQSSAMCIIMLGGEDTHPWSATKVGDHILASIPVDQ